MADKLPDYMPVVLLKTRVTVSEYPAGEADIFPPQYHSDQYRSTVPIKRETSPDSIPVIPMGRQGGLYWRARPSDDAFVAMLGSSKRIIRMVLQDLGPVCIPGTKLTLPGCVWPKKYLSVLG
jgi:hypothetical protein